MAVFRARKQELRVLLLPPAWPEEAGAVPDGVVRHARPDSISPLLALLPRGGLVMWRAALLCGIAVARLAGQNMEAARIVMRRLLWHLNEDSGNMGWGIPQAFGEILAQSPKLAAEYGRIALSYARDTGFADNYLDHGALRRGAYWAIGRFAPLYPGFQDEGKEILSRGLRDEDPQCRGIAAWGLGKFVRNGSFGEEEKRTLAALLAGEPENNALCEILDGSRLYAETASFFTRQTLRFCTDGRQPPGSER